MQVPLESSFWRFNAG